MKNKKTNPAADTAKNAFANLVFTFFSDRPGFAFNYRQTAAQLGISDKREKEMIRRALETLCAQGSLVESNRGKYKLNPVLIAAVTKANVLTGTVDMKSSGKAYVMTPDLTEDIYIAPGNTHHALNGDKVKVHLFPKRKDRRAEGTIVEIVERARKQFVGIIYISKRFAFLVPDSSSIPVDIYIPINSLKGAKDGQKVVARISEWPEQATNPVGEIIQVLGEPGDNNVEMNSILAELDFPLKFPKAAEDEAKKIKNTVPDSEIKKRRDFRDVWTCTIDPVDAKDFDDALSLKKLPDGCWEVGVHIADVSHYVTPGSAIDAEAFDRGTSIYLVDRTIPMLPEQLSNLVCSLRPDEEKLCFSAVFKMNEKAEILDEWFGRTVIRSNRRYAYEEVQVIIEGAEGDFRDELMVLHRLSSKLREERFKKGSIAFKSQEVKFRLDEKGKPIGVMIKEQKEANWLIEDFMLLANKQVARMVGEKKGEAEAKTFVYRIHDEPNPDKLANFSEFLGKLGYKFQTTSRKSITASFNQLFQNILGKGEENMIETIAIRTMMRAEYSTQNIGHYGLAFNYYTHFTSPIRRYPDLMVHRLLQWYLDGKPSANKEEYEQYCVHCSEMERKAMEAERASVKYKQAEYLMDKIGEEFDGLISGVSKWGIYVELTESKCEGMIPLRNMNDDYYYLDEENYRIIGQRSGKVYRLGDALKIKVKKIDLQKKQMDFEQVREVVAKKRW
ncbi:MAG: ribonuclease R [Bacteroidales bacterium]|nr:ribonuclease R [Bacteroidales bacterium]